MRRRNGRRWTEAFRSEREIARSARWTPYGSSGLSAQTRCCPHRRRAGPCGKEEEEATTQDARQSEEAVVDRHSLKKTGGAGRPRGDRRPPEARRGGVMEKQRRWR